MQCAHNFLPLSSWTQPTPNLDPNANANTNAKSRTTTTDASRSDSWQSIALGFGQKITGCTMLCLYKEARVCPNSIDMDCRINPIWMNRMLFKYCRANSNAKHQCQLQMPIAFCITCTGIVVLADRKRPWGCLLRLAPLVIEANPFFIAVAGAFAWTGQAAVFAHHHRLHTKRRGAVWKHLHTKFAQRT